MRQRQNRFGLTGKERNEVSNTRLVTRSKRTPYYNLDYITNLPLTLKVKTIENQENFCTRYVSRRQKLSVKGEEKEVTLESGRK